MKNYKLLGLIAVIALSGFIMLISTYNKPSIEVSAEANATSTAILPKPATREEEPQEEVKVEPTSSITYIYQTLERQVGPNESPVTPTVNEPIGSVNETVKETSETFYVPTPIYTTVYVEPSTSQPVTQPITQPTEPANQVETPVEQPVEVVEALPSFTEAPKAWVEARNNGDWLFFQASWDTVDKGVIKCNGIFYNKSVRSGFPGIIEVSTSALGELPSGTLVTCDFTVGSLGGTTLTYTIK